MTTLSVALCTYNGEDHLAEQLESLAAQTCLPDEVVACDDGSTDRTIDMLNAFAARAPFPVRLYRNPARLGTTKNFESAIGRCTGEVIALADQDDIWRPVKLERMRAALASPAVGLVFSDADLIDERSRPLNRRLWDLVGDTHARRALRDRARALRLLLPGWTVTGATLAFRCELRTMALPIPTVLPMIHDGWIALVASAVAEVRFIDEPLILYRQHAAQQVGARAKPRDRASMREALYRARRYTDVVRTIAELRQRLAASGVAVEPAIAKELDVLAAHFDARRELPATWLRRAPVVARELLARRYHHYGNGFFSAGRDLVRGSTVSQISSL